MKTTVIPAQITTIEDKISGNLSMSQLLILLFSSLFSGSLYIFLPPYTHFAWYKSLLSLLIFTISAILTIRIQGKIIANWLVIILSFNLRPRYYIFNKNHSSSRNLYLPTPSTKIQTQTSKQETKTETPRIAIPDTLKFENLLNKHQLNIRFKSNPKGGLHVAFE